MTDPATPPPPSPANTAAPDPATGTGTGTATAAPLTGRPPEPAPKIRWVRLLVIGAPIALLLLGGWYMATRSSFARWREKSAAPDRMLKQYPNQPEMAFGYWRRLLDAPATAETGKEQARVAIQDLIDHHSLMGRFEDLIAGLVSRGELDFKQARTYGDSMLYLDQQFKTKESAADGQKRVASLEDLRASYADAINDKVARAQFDKAIEKLTALYARHPDADFLRALIAGMQVEVADALISLDRLEEAQTRMEVALKMDPQPVYLGKLNMLKADIVKLDPSKDLAKAQAAEASGDREEAQADYESALRNRRSNEQARAGYTRILKFYAQIFLKNAEDNHGDLSEEGERFCKLAEKNGKMLVEYGDDSLILARAELLLADSEFLDENMKQARDLADTGINSISVAQRATPEGSYLMARAFKLYYHLGKGMGKIPESKQALLLADQYCRLAMEKGNEQASRLFVQIANLEQMESDQAMQARAESVTAPVDTTPPPGDFHNIIDDGPLAAAAPVDALAPTSDLGTALKPAQQGAPEQPPTDTPKKPHDLPADHDPAYRGLLNPLSP